MIILVSSFLLLIYFVGGLVYVLVTKEQYQRKLKPSYQKEFTLIMSVSGMGVLGMGILFLYFGGAPLYVPHVIIPLGIVVFTGLSLIGDRYFNVSLLQRRKR
jgi:amino acid transporter